MPLEIEIKLKLDSHEAVRKMLKSQRAKHVGKVRETNIFFDYADRSLRAADSGSRVRLTSTGRSALLTFKGPAARSGLHSRNAYDLHITPADQLLPLLTALGLQQIFLFEKDRDSWIVGDCQVELDTLPHFGHFLEIEGPSEAKVRAVQRKLGLQAIRQVSASYSKMVGEYLRRHVELSRELQFSR